MHDSDIRLECLRLAAQHTFGLNDSTLLDRAKTYAEFVIFGALPAQPQVDGGVEPPLSTGNTSG